MPRHRKAQGIDFATHSVRDGLLSLDQQLGACDTLNPSASQSHVVKTWPGSHIRAKGAMGSARNMCET